MQSETQSTSPIVRFFDSFLQERNIKWVLTVGVLILLGSSLMLVTTHWADYTPMWKFLIMLGYAGAIYVASQWSYHKLGLRTTGTLLMVLTVLLLPVLFLALHWVQAPVEQLTDVEPRAPGSPGFWLANAVNLALLSITFVFAAIASSRIFTHFLRKPQITFIVSYLVLCISGALATALPAVAAPWAALGLWVMFTIGTVKVNRHVFWLTEEHQLPRVFGFFPTALLSAMFFGLFVLNFAPHVSWQWIGFGLVLVAVPMLMMADTVAKVFQQRTGELVRPMPWSVVPPMLVGLMLCLSGLCLSASELFDAQTPYAVVPTAALVAAMMGLVARRSKKSAFVWVMLVTATLAYNFSPVFFKELARQFVQSGATAVREERLPFAFYGLTYLPLISVLMIVHVFARRAKSTLFANPVKWFSVGLSGLLLCASVGHTKAMFPVAAVMVVVFGVQTIIYRQRVLAMAAAIAWFIAAYGLASFADGVMGYAVFIDSQFVCVAGAAVVMMFVGQLLDPKINALAKTASCQSDGDWACGDVLREKRLPLLQMASGVVAIGLVGSWFSRYMPVMVHDTAIDVAGVVSAAAITGMLIVFGLRLASGIVGGIAIVFAYVSSIVIACSYGASGVDVLSAVTIALLAQWCASYVMGSREDRFGKAIGSPNFLISTVGLWVLTLLVYVPAIGEGYFDDGLITPWLVCRVAMIVWAFDAAWRNRSRVLTCVGFISVLGITGSWIIEMMGREGFEWLPVLWTAIATATLLPVDLIRRRIAALSAIDAVDVHRDNWMALAAPLDALVLAVLSLATIASLAVFTVPMRVTGGVALVGLLLIGVLRTTPAARVMAAALVNWQLILLVVTLFSPEKLNTIFDLGYVNIMPVCLPVALAAAISLFVLHAMPRSSDAMGQYVAKLHRAGLRTLVVIAMVATLGIDNPTLVQLVDGGLVFGFFVMAELCLARLRNDERRVWVAEAIIGLAVAWYAMFGVINFGRGISMFVVFGIGMVLWVMGRIASNHESWKVFANPLRVTGVLMPLATVAIAVGRHTFVGHEWYGRNCLALMLPAAFYLWRGIEDRRKSLMVLSAIIFNANLMLLWHDLSWTDAQFYMIPIGATIIALGRLLRRDMPTKAFEAMNYIGSLMILVSPMFHILGGSWIHMFSLMVASVCVVLLSIGWRVRALVYTGSAFLLADLVAMVVRGSVDNPSVLWIAGLILGGMVVALGAVAERNRELVLQRMRMVSAALDTWK